MEELINLWWEQHQKTIRNSSILAYSKIINYVKENLEITSNKFLEKEEMNLILDICAEAFKVILWGDWQRLCI